MTQVMRGLQGIPQGAQEECALDAHMSEWVEGQTELAEETPSRGVTIVCPPARTGSVTVVGLGSSPRNLGESFKKERDMEDVKHLLHLSQGCHVGNA